MVPIGGKPLLEHQIELLRRHGIEEVYLLLGYRGEAIQQHFGNGSQFGMAIYHVMEDAPLGSAGCLRPLRQLIDDDFLIVYGDLMIDMDLGKLFSFHQSHGALATLTIHANSHPGDSDLVVLDDDNRITKFLFKNTPRPAYYRNLVSAAVYAVSPAVFGYINDDGECDFIHDVAPAILHGCEEIFGYRSVGYIRDIGTPARLAAVNEDFSSGLVHGRDSGRPAIFLDRDGVIVKHVDLLNRPEQLELFEWSAKAVRTVNRSQFLCFVVSNQPVVARNMCSLETLDLIHAKMETLLGHQSAFLDDVFYCPHHPDSGYPEENPEFKISCNCRKPGTGLIQQAAARAEVDQRPVVAFGGRRRIDGGGQHVRPHHHARAAAEGGVVHGAVFIACEVANVHRFQRPDAVFQSLAG